MRGMKRNGQNTLEYVLLVTAVVGAFLAIQYYLNRGLQGRVRDAADNLGTQFDAGLGSSEYKTHRSSLICDTNMDGITRSELEQDETTYRTGSESVKAPGTQPAPRR